MLKKSINTDTSTLKAVFLLIPLRKSLLIWDLLDIYTDTLSISENYPIFCDLFVANYFNG
ncbi:hypothetical protein VCHA39O220_140072 [Vibrio chagasii]|nr:hypothetical protein VCHA39O220_140072 [Vibrio chagasii]CAH7179864.1 hypothetical protein VCHA39O224_130047 [Vibrio chagasii]